MRTSQKETLKRFLGEIPLTAELYWLVRQKGMPISSRFSLQKLNQNLPEIVAQIKEIKPKSHNENPKKVFIFGSMHLWINVVALTALGLSADGNDVTFGYYPYADWFTDQSKFDLRRQNIYAQKVLKEAEPYLKSVSFLTYRAPYTPLPEALLKSVEDVTVFDTQYTLQIEDIDHNWPTYKFRYKRNFEAATSIYDWLRNNKPDVVVVPNGTVQEFGIVYRVARYLKIPTVTYEFSDQRESCWMGLNQEIMRQDTSKMWDVEQETNFTHDQHKRIQALFESRRTAKVNENFTRTWQNLPAQGAQSVKDELKLDDRPIVLLATNVLGDSLTLGRQVFSKTMADWVSRTILYFIGRPDIQLVIRIHPGEILTREYSMVDVVRQTLPELPEYIHVIHPEEKINTYDLIDISDLGLVYTTTVGLEMSLKGIPVIVAGNTHYRGRGFTYDPDSWVEYFKLLANVLAEPKSHRLPKEKIEMAWKYAYHFFFTFPRPFPWHIKVWQDFDSHSMKQVFSAEGRKKYADTFRQLVGEPIDWTKVNHNGHHS
ncbi:MAG: hypothetical protein AB9897_04840 [Anaerolineaceae bacterium]